MRNHAPHHTSRARALDTDEDSDTVPLLHRARNNRRKSHARYALIAVVIFLFGFFVARASHRPASPSPRAVPLVESGTRPDVLLGVISNPSNVALRQQLRDFNRLAGTPLVRTEFVFGEKYFGNAPSAEEQAWVAREVEQYDDVKFVDGREKLPHVGKATEKSAAWWRTAPLRSEAHWFCKTDDDSLVHTRHLHAALSAARAQTNTRYAMLWRPRAEPALCLCAPRVASRACRQSWRRVRAGATCAGAAGSAARSTSRHSIA
jgi:hypothetical protein